eukprot:g8807.t1
MSAEVLELLLEDSQRPNGETKEAPREDDKFLVVRNLPDSASSLGWFDRYSSTGKVANLTFFGRSGDPRSAVLEAETPEDAAALAKEQASGGGGRYADRSDRDRGARPRGPPERRDVRARGGRSRSMRGRRPVLTLRGRGGRSMSPGHALSRDQKQLVSMDGHRGPRRYQGRGDRPGDRPRDRLRGRPERGGHGQRDRERDRGGYRQGERRRMDRSDRADLDDRREGRRRRRHGPVSRRDERPDRQSRRVDTSGGTEAAKRMTEDLVVIAQKTCDRVAVVGAADACARTAERLETEQMAMSLARGRAQLQTNEARKMKEAKEQAAAKRQEAVSVKKQATDKAARVEKLKREIEMKKQEIMALTQEAKETRDDSERLHREAEVKAQEASRAEAVATEKEDVAATAKAKGDEHAAILAEFDKKYGTGPPVKDPKPYAEGESDEGTPEFCCLGTSVSFCPFDCCRLRGILR